MRKWSRSGICYRLMSVISFIYVIFIFKNFSGWIFISLLSGWMVLVILIEIKIKQDRKLQN